MVGTSIWKDRAGEDPKYPTLKGEYEADIVIIGAGITGLTTALRLIQSNKKVIVIEGLNIGSGTTGESSCHLTTEIESNYFEVAKSFGLETAQKVAESRKEAINFIETITKVYNINCDFRRVPGYLFAENKKSVTELKKEQEGASRAGIEVVFTETIPLELNHFGALKFEDQAEFDSQKYLNAMARHITSKGVQIFENSFVTDIIEENDQFIVTTKEGSIKSKEVVQATHYPLFINILQTLAAPYRSYLMAFRLEQEFPKGLFWNTDDPYYYIRTIEDENGRILLVGGADHKTGQETDNEKSFHEIEKYTRARFKVGEVLYNWSSQYYTPSDGLPYIGQNPIGSQSYIATGYAGDGLVYGTVAGIILSDILSGKENPWQNIYSPKRFTPGASAKEFIKENADVAYHFVADRFKNVENGFSDIAAGEGKIVKHENEKYAVARDQHNQLHILSPVCTHLKCFVQWNKEETSWDCPCHGSRFSIDGKVVTGPAVTNLEKKKLPSSQVVPKKK